MGKGNFRPPTESTPLNRSQKIVAHDYVGDPNGCAKLGAHPSTGGFWAHGWNITKIIFYLHPFSRNSPIGQTRRRIFTHYGSNEADSRKDMPLCFFSYGSPFRGSKPPKQFWGYEYKFTSQTREIKTRAYYQNYCIDSNEILHSDKDHQMTFVGGTNTHHRSKIADGRHLEKWNNRHISAPVWPIGTKCGMVTQFDPLDHSDRYKFKI